MPYIRPYAHVWSSLTPAEKAMLARDTERLRALDKFLSCLQAVDSGDYEIATNYAGEVRHLLRVIISHSRHTANTNS